jgi:hypothetical protein
MVAREMAAIPKRPSEMKNITFNRADFVPPAELASGAFLGVSAALLRLDCVILLLQNASFMTSLGQSEALAPQTDMGERQ